MSSGRNAFCLDASASRAMTAYSICRAFDFTVRFENLVLSVLPNALFVATFALFRLPRLLRKPSKLATAAAAHGAARSDLLLGLRALPNGAAVIIQVALITLIESRLAHDSQLRLTLDGSSFSSALALSLLAAFTQLGASWLERLRVTGGNFLLPSFLIATILFDAARLRTFVLLGLANSVPAFVGLFATLLALKCVSLVLESINAEGSPSPPNPSPTSSALPYWRAPEASATFLSRLGFFWVFPLLARGLQGTIELDTLDPLHPRYATSRLRTKLARNLLASSPNPDTCAKADTDSEVDAATQRSSSNSPQRHLLVACLRSFFVPAILKPALPRLILTAAQLGLPFLISDTIGFINSYRGHDAASPPPQAAAVGWAIAGAFGLLFFVIAAATGQYFFAVSQASTMLRGALTSSVLHKSLNLAHAESTALGASAASNLLSTDVEKVIFCIDPFHELWSGLVIIGVGAYILWLQIGISFLAPLVTTFAILVLTPLVSRGLGDRQKAWSSVTDSRLKATDSLIRAIRTVKMMAWDNVSLRTLLEFRQAEVKAMRRYYSQLSAVVSATNLAADALLLVTFVVFALVDRRSHPDTTRFDTQTIFTALSALNLISTPLLMIGQRFAILLSALASLDRIQHFLELPPSTVQPESDTPSTASMSLISLLPAAPQIDLVSASIAWPTGGGAQRVVFTDLTLSFPAGRLSTVSGPVNCGKSSLMLALLGELPLAKGIFGADWPRHRLATIPFVNQACWVQESRSVRDNILLFRAMDPSWYRVVLEAVALDHDLERWDDGDRHPAKALSGGQRQRVAIARALYASRSAPVVLLDDAFSALDARVERHVFDALFAPVKGLLCSKTVVLVTNSSRIISRSALHIELDFSGNVIRCDARPALLPDADRGSRASELDEALGKADSEAEAEAEVQAHTEAVQLAQGSVRRPSSEKPAPAVAVDKSDQKATQSCAQDPELEQVAESSIGWPTYKVWVERAGYGPIALVLTLNVGVAAFGVGAQVVLEKWAHTNEVHPGQAFGAWIVGFSAINMATALAFVGFFYLWLLWVVPRASLAVHADEARALFGAPLSFFQDHPAGRLLNRFSQDLFLIDWDWPVQASNFSSNLLTLLGSLALMTASAPFLAIIIAALVLLSVALRKLYIPSSRQLRRLEIASKSPLYGAASDILGGGAILRAFSVQEAMLAYADACVERSQRPYYHVYAVRRWLQTWLNLVTLVINVSLILLCVGLRRTRMVALVGVSLTQTTQISQQINNCLISWTEAEIAAVAIERVTEIIQTRQEDDKTQTQHGLGSARNSNASPNDHRHETSTAAAISFQRFSAWYDEEQQRDQQGKESSENAPETVRAPDLYLERLDLPRGTYTGVCGRSGSGKSTLLLAIGRLLGRTAGRMLLDGCDAESLALREVRSRIIVVPQDPLIIQGRTLRQNLDVEGRCSGNSNGGGDTDELLLEALDEVGLRSTVLGLARGLDTVFDSDSAWLSPGQLQLFALARALVLARTNARAEVLLLDEINSSLDASTNERVQQLIRRVFARRLTVVSVVHRLDSVYEFDHVLVMERGHIGEFGTPNELLGNQSGLLSRLLQAREHQKDARAPATSDGQKHATS
ncbi:P-loop containing nucleoside triphosphate hydrolase protein [Tilletiaria anomala UBC 951]|uniref:p-loop containing nucleoside triphosphate hydrolase protein n=1 Tax=Tilletiaria anomala (strain ATCC 24038 / CBS 436.72 / UBC 951) TaxID=1037660 RepID=A0A066VGF1_TILAU|nr:P-loop containing nucleoside triphosphate hydrolase protein [Tilletiaria anomala UBC 951]KDN37670.1 P-loop containing nucleoside triphosphate hydrolase protein [Tilletiaria anomala UBC 951]